MLAMSKKKPGRKQDPDSKRSQGLDRHAEPRLAFHLEQELLDALDAYRSGQRVKPPVSEVLRTALREFLRREGCWPPAEKVDA
jgi:hypothetical protein